MHLLVNDYNKIVYDSVDYSKAMKTWNSDTMVVTDKAIYIGAPHSFAARFFYMSVVNSTGSVMSVKYYAGNSTWKDVKNLADETAVGAAPLAKSGFISWDLPTGWVKSQVNDLPEIPATATAGDGQGYLWIKIEFATAINATIEWLGLLWTNQDYMATRWPEVVGTRFLPTGKTHWYELIEMTTNDVAKDLEYSNIISYELQAKDISEMADMTALRCLINILTPLISNEKYREMRKIFMDLYDTAKRAKVRSIDSNENEEIEQLEADPPTSMRLKRY